MAFVTILPKSHAGREPPGPGHDVPMTISTQPYPSGMRSRRRGIQPESTTGGFVVTGSIAR